MALKVVNQCGTPVLFESRYLPDTFEVRTFERNGVMERSVRQAKEWVEVGAYSGDGPDRLAQWALEPTAEELQRRETEKEDRRLEAREKNAIRAKTACRRAIIAEGFNELLTLTYRENQTDRSLCKKHFKEWVRRMKRALPGFRYCASFERQERGSMHVHLATHKLPEHAAYRGVKIEAWKLGTKVWRSVVGDDNGMCFVGGNTKFGGKRRNVSLAKMAAYVSKYIMKDHADVPEEMNRYSRSLGEPTPKPEVMRLHGCTMAEMIAVCFELGEGDILHSWSINPLNGTMWLVKECGRSSGESLVNIHHRVIQ